MNVSVLKRYGLPLCLLILSFLSFQFNLFRVTSQDWFENFQLDSESTLLDGIVHHRLVPGGSGLGSYSGGTLTVQPTLLNNRAELLNDRAHMDRPQDSRAFIPHLTLFGLQYYFFNYLYSVCHLSVQQLEAVASLLMSLIVAAYFIALRRIVPILAALGFCLTIALSPWTVCFARNPFWVEGTWFLPCLVSLFLGIKRPTFGNQLTLGSLLFLTTLIKFLCGYDFITTVCLAALAPLVYYHARNDFSVKIIARQLGVACLAMFLAFVCAIGLHAALLNNRSVTSAGTMKVGSAKSAVSDGCGFTVILRAAEKRLYSKDPDMTAREACLEGEAGGVIDPECVSKIRQSLQSNVFLVVARYLVVPDFVPWVSSISLSRVDESDKPGLKVFLAAKPRHFSEALRLVRTLHGPTLLFILSYTISAFAFLAFNVLVAHVLYRRKKLSDVLWLGIALASPISWYVMAKGHSYIHTHMCYVLWYLPYVPVAVTLLLCEYSTHQKDKNSAHSELGDCA